jgi:hypothetical protein
MKAISRAATAALSLCVSSIVFGQDFFYPPKGRTEAQQRQDRFECHEWAVAQSRFDPVEFAARAPSGTTSTTAPSTNANASGGQAGRAVIGGAATGAAIGEVANNDAGKGAMVGGAAGLLRARMEDKKAAAERAAAQAEKQSTLQQAQAKQSQELRAGRDAYDRARSACFKGRGYTVSE